MSKRTGTQILTLIKDYNYKGNSIGVFIFTDERQKNLYSNAFLIQTE